MHRCAVPVLCGLLVVAACRKENLPPDASATTATIAPVTTQLQPTPTTVDVASPATAEQLQDPAYWNAILATLHHVVGNALRSAATQRAVEPSVVRSLQQIYGQPAFDAQYMGLVEIADGKDNGLLIPPGDPLAAVTKILTADSQCVTLEAFLDYTKVNPTLPNSPIIVKLLRRSTTEGLEFNPTPWAIDVSFIPESPDEGRELCAE